MKLLLFFIFVLFINPCLPLYALSQNNSENLFYFGHLRTGYYGSYAENNLGETLNTHEWRSRVRLGAGYHVNENVSFRIRFAGRFSTEQDQFRFWLDDHLPTRSGIRMGESTIDVVELRWQITDKLMLHAGRFQSNYSLNSLVTKGLHRYDNPNTLISWTDGILLKWQATDRWQVEYTGEYNSENGPGSIAFNPLTFSEPASRFSHTLVVKDVELPGGWLQREIGIHTIPSALPTADGFDSYSIITARVIHEIPGLNWQNADYSLAAEAGFAPNAPETSLLHDRDNAFAFQTVLSVRNFAGPNNFGVLYGFADPGWLLSPSFRPNSHSYEVRYQRRFTDQLSAEIRYRLRTNPFVPAGLQSVDDGDIYARFTFSF